jgi:prepilin-type N-terminal cleavage/methylation domain-containing protein
MPQARRGYTLVEVMVALVLMAIISIATGFAMSMALRNDASARARTDAAEEARSVLSVLVKDLRNAYASSGNAASCFIASGGDEGEVLRLTTTNVRLRQVAPESDLLQEPPPQSDVGTVTYTLNHSEQTLYRTVSAEPIDEFGASPGPLNLLSRRVTGLTLRLVASDGSERSDWSYEATTGAAGAQDATLAQGDTELPTLAEVTVELAGDRGALHTASAMVNIITPSPQERGQAPAAASPPAAGGGQGTRRPRTARPHLPAHALAPGWRP